ncbi:MAG: LysM peptidoglycan-binding domain-containing protein, partial [Bacteroidales bacterium]|nr:LysM peptidoglycan-binding domain-containing protein [Bacteroidales bacterium]
MKRFTSIIVAALLSLWGTAALAQEYVPTPVTVSKEKVKLNGKVYLSHVVMERQTLYGIANAYGVKVDDIYEANPSLRETGLQKNAIILIPFKEMTEEAPVNKTFIEHSVKWYEDLEDIARRYNVSVKEIMDLNKLDSKKLNTRQVLKIPVPVVKEEATDQAGNEGAGNETPAPQEAYTGDDESKANTGEAKPAEETKIEVVTEEWPQKEEDKVSFEFTRP